MSLPHRKGLVIVDTGGLQLEKHQFSQYLFIDLLDGVSFLRLLLLAIYILLSITVLLTPTASLHS